MICRISADVAQEFEERRPQQILVGSVARSRQTQARERRREVLPHPGCDLRVLLRRRGDLLIDTAHSGGDGVDDGRAGIVTHCGGKIEKIAYSGDAGVGLRPLTA